MDLERGIGERVEQHRVLAASYAQVKTLRSLRGFAHQNLDHEDENARPSDSERVEKVDPLSSQAQPRRKRGDRPHPAASHPHLLLPLLRLRLPQCSARTGAATTHTSRVRLQPSGFQVQDFQHPAFRLPQVSLTSPPRTCLCLRRSDWSMSIMCLETCLCFDTYHTNTPRKPPFSRLSVHRIRCAEWPW